MPKFGFSCRELISVPTNWTTGAGVLVGSCDMGLHDMHSGYSDFDVRLRDVLPGSSMTGEVEHEVPR